MAEILNLRQARKAKAKREKVKQADANRLHFGRSKAEKETALAASVRDREHLDGHKLDRSKKPPTPQK